MSLADSLAAVRDTPPAGRVCHTRWLLRRLDDRDAEALRKALDSDMTHEQIATLIASEGLPPIAATSIARHRRGKCRCESR